MNKKKIRGKNRTKPIGKKGTNKAKAKVNGKKEKEKKEKQREKKKQM